jgi:hypothetical protein
MRWMGTWVDLDMNRILGSMSLIKAEIFKETEEYNTTIVHLDQDEEGLLC